jgi:hypothetical protein
MWYRPPDLAEFQTAIAHVGYSIRGLVNKCIGLPAWGFKDPRTCLTIPVLHPYLPNPRYIYITRDKPAIVASLTRRASQRGYYEPPEHWENLYDVYNDRAVSFLSSIRMSLTGGLLILSYEQLTHPKDCKLNVQMLAGFAGVGSSEDVERATALVRHG